MVNYLADTNILIALMKEESTVVEKFTQIESISVPFIVIGELYYGARQSAQMAANLSNVEWIANRYPVVFPNMDTMRFYGVIRSELKSAGRPIPEADLWIAALARQHSMTVATRDSHFQFVAGIKFEDWRK